MIQWIKHLFTKKQPLPIETPLAFALTKEQLEQLQQLYFVMDFERANLQLTAPELLLKWQQFMEQPGHGWHWFPQISDLQNTPLKDIVLNNSMYFEQTNQLQAGADFDYRLIGPAIIAQDGSVLCRGKVELVSLQKDDDFLVDLENL